MHTIHLSRPFAALAALTLLLAPARAQQFQHQVGMIPGTPRWSEGLECADVDNDGDLDVFVADGEGFSSAGTQRQNVLLMNQLVGTGTLGFLDESVARLGVNLSNAKGVTTGDVNGDGWTDALFANAFNTDPPFLYVNRGAMGPGHAGFFDQQGAARGFNLNLSSAGAQFGDVDDDGDLDAILCDSGPSFLSGPGGKPRLFINDGNGFFDEEQGSRWDPPTKIAHMDVQLADVDHDWDLDFVGLNRASNSGGTHYLMLNDATGAFTNSSTTIPNTSSSVYEAEVGDLDGDRDLDLFFVSLTGFQEGAMENSVLPGGTLGFTSQGGLGLSEDDNEIVLLDYDVDGDFDSFVGSLGAQERLWRNDGGFSYVASHASIQAVSDSTLDMSAADLDNDGDYDLLTAQGESNGAQWANKVYLNSGPADDLAPVIAAVQQVGPLETPMGPWIAHAKIQDQVLDDGVNYVRAFSRFVVNPTPLAQGVTITGGGFTNVFVAPGTTVTWSNASGANQTVTSTTAPYTYDSGVIAPGGTYSHAFVSPGVYAYTSTPSGFVGTVTVTGVAIQEKALHQRGNQYRFAMAGDASAPQAELVYELHFVDWAGNESVSDSFTSQAMFPVGTAYCFGDGSGTFCQCLNFGAPGNGCGNGIYQDGCNLAAFGSASVANDTVVLTATQSVNGQPGLFFQGDNEVNGGDGVSFGDGLRCAGGSVVRLQPRTASGNGLATTTIGIAAKGGVSAGQTKRYQWWYRDPTASPCGTLFNLSNGLRITWAP